MGTTKRMVTRPSEPTIFIQSHLGLGDMLVANSIFRHFAETHNVIIPVKFHNIPSVAWMVRGLPIALLGVEDDKGADNLMRTAAKRHKVLKLGMFHPPFDEKHWDREFYRQAGIPFEKRWSEWKVQRDLSREFEPPNEPYAFVHEDPERDFKISNYALRDIEHDGMKIVIPTPGKTDNIFDYVRLIENATEIHMIDSSFAILADSLTTLKAKRKVVHLYARKNALPPTYKPEWEILK